MKIERFKSILLVLLVISSIVLTINKWFNEKLWPEGYNFFAVITDKFSFGKDKFISSLTKETISFPKNINKMLQRNTLVDIPAFTSN